MKAAANLPTFAAHCCRVLLALLLGALLSACSTLLPRSSSEVVSQWRNYDDAVKSLSSITPYQATRQDVHDAGLNPHHNAAVTVLHLADLLQKFSAAAMIGTTDVDRGVRDCLHAGKRCTAYAISVRKRSSQRSGNFWLDSLNFKRQTITTGWSVEALLIFVDDQLVYQLVGGQPTIDELDTRHNPLGPLQSWGDKSLNKFP